MNLSISQIEAITLFIRDRIPLWKAHCEQLGVADPDAVVKALAQAHHKAVGESMEEQP